LSLAVVVDGAAGLITTVTRGRGASWAAASEATARAQTMPIDGAARRMIVITPRARSTWR
jgi:hypothetical protein